MKGILICLSVRAISIYYGASRHWNDSEPIYYRQHKRPEGDRQHNGEATSWCPPVDVDFQYQGK